MRRLSTALITAALLGVAFGLNAPARAAAARVSGVVLYVTPAHLAPGARVHAVVHLRGLRPGGPVEVQVNPPAPATVVLADVHTHATPAGTLDQSVAFVAPRAGDYIVFVNLGSYADPTSPIAGSSLQTLLPVGRTARLSFRCAPVPPPASHPVITCMLGGRGFSRAEALRIAYSIEVQWMQGGANHVRHSTYRRAGRTDASGAFTRPPFWVTIPSGAGMRVWSIMLRADVQGARGENVYALTGGVAD